MILISCNHCYNKRKILSQKIGYSKRLRCVANIYYLDYSVVGERCEVQYKHTICTMYYDIIIESSAITIYRANWKNIIGIREVVIIEHY
jgi:hypothetical protein